MKKYLFTLISILAFAGITLTGCTTENSDSSSSQITSIVDSNITTENTIESTVTGTTESSESISNSAYLPTTNFDELQSMFSSVDLKASNWTSDKAAYIELNNNQPIFDNITSDVFEEYSDLDELGRCGLAFANICTELQPTEERGNIGMIKPSGWKTSNYNEHPGLVDGNYLYNRCHLIGFQLAGENANEKNLITGTRYLNIEGMLPFENMVDDYIEENPNNHVLYRVTPSYIDNDLVAQGVLMEAYSVEDNGKLQFCVWCYNVQPNITIDYSTGDNWLSTEISTITTESIEENISNNDVTYILNTNSKKIHEVNCSAIKDTKPQNKKETNKTIEELEAEGYTTCGICKPTE